jgi:hypothetical protein
MSDLYSILLPIAANVLGRHPLPLSAMMAERCVARARSNSRLIIRVTAGDRFWRGSADTAAMVRKLREERKHWIAEARRWLTAGVCEGGHQWP